MRVIKRPTFLLLLTMNLVAVHQVSVAQESNSGKFSMQDCIDYALENATEVRNAVLDEEIAQAQVKEVFGLGLPQVNGSVSVQQSPTLQRFYGQYTPGSSFGPTADQAAQAGIESGDVYASENFFQLKGAGDANLNIDQLIFNGSYFVGLKASKAFKNLAIKQKNKTKGDIQSDVAKSYFNVLINEDRLRLFSASLARLDTLYRHTVSLNENGFAEQIEVDRLKVALNNMQSDYDNLKNFSILSKRMLKFQMNYPLNQPLELSGSIEDVLSRPISDITDVVDYNNRPDYQVLIANQELQELNLKNKYAELLPVIGAFARLGYSTQSPNFGGLFTTNSNFSEQGGVGPDKWYNYSTVGLRLSWSLFTGMQRNYQIQQQKIELEKIDNNIRQFENLINIEVKDAGLTLQNAIDKFEVQKENMALADRIFRISLIKYEEGVGSNLEVVEADSALKDAQTNYFNALFEAIIAKIDLNRALGTNE
ncbi:MAG: TolC family protein [Reichenbachiella sp.]|uniref:TolC family protein n=1 Tax=Reichenbachiella sp. TaxID=2184521 RepID=UPI003265CDEB